MEQEIETVKVEEKKVDGPTDNATLEGPSESQDSESGAGESESSPEPGEDTNKPHQKNPMREIEIEKMVLHCGGTEDKLEKSIKLLKTITNSKKIYIVKSTKRIPAFGISPGKQSGCKITIRDKDKINDLLKRFFSSLDDTIKKKQVTENQFCFGIHEYIEVPGLEYDRDIGISGFEVMVVFKRKGKRVGIRKIKRGSVPKKQLISKEEIVEFLIKNFDLEVEEK